MVRMAALAEEPAEFDQEAEAALGSGRGAHARDEDDLVLSPLHRVDRRHLHLPEAVPAELLDEQLPLRVVKREHRELRRRQPHVLDERGGDLHARVRLRHVGSEELAGMLAKKKRKCKRIAVSKRRTYEDPQEHIRQLEAEHGYDNLLNLTGGILEWQAQIDPSLARY